MSIASMPVLHMLGGSAVAEYQISVDANLSCVPCRWATRSCVSAKTCSETGRFTWRTAPRFGCRGEDEPRGLYDEDPAKRPHDRRRNQHVWHTSQGMFLASNLSRRQQRNEGQGEECHRETHPEHDAGEGHEAHIERVEKSFPGSGDCSP